MTYNRPIVLSIAGFDPSGGAGVLADVKTFEQHKCLGMAVVTSLTEQTEDKFFDVEWLKAGKIISQLKPIIEQYDVTFIKVGIIESVETLQEVVNWLKQQKPKVKIVWDPVISASAGPMFLKNVDPDKLQDLMKSLYLITPNVKEAKILGKKEDPKEAAKFLATFCNVLLKGGHSETEKGIDFLYAEGKVVKIEDSKEELPAKHGSGCILSSAITANLALGQNVEDACRNGKKYIEQILKSNSDLLAYHVQ
ncbi:MAG: hydroxymethylpyrimidine/phosphomethylpyrimidine kinase [Bacteroidota bacterium]|nr:hydroxymethylpyrimidine/phosphomethylpyrimidine kinase [Bacteroidota bacterium]